ARDIENYLRLEIRPGDQIVVRGNMHDCNVCLQWHLNQFPECLAVNPQAVIGKRIWFVDEQSAEELDGSPEPRMREPGAYFQDAGTVSSWPVTRHRRFLEYSPSEKRKVFRWCCDVSLRELTIRPAANCDPLKNRFSSRMP
ncbi:MAG: hypothetical protein ACRD36_06100, partial [Candidatus Acidiferrum sp.]